MELFVKRATEKDFLQSLEETSASFRIAREISDNYKDIIRINLVLLTNKARESEIEETLEILKFQGLAGVSGVHPKPALNTVKFL